MSFWCITTFFNPAGYKTPVDNYILFADNLRKQNANLLTIETSFNDHFYLPGNIIKINGKDVMWLKERMINHAISLLPDDCDAFAWLDADLIFPDNWIELAQEKLKQADMIQLFKRVFYLPKGHKCYSGQATLGFQGIVAQSKTYNNWLEKRREKDIPFAAPGFAWAAKRGTFPNGIFDRDVIGSGDCTLVDCLMDTWDLHGYDRKFTDHMKKDIQRWKEQLKKPIKVDYISADVFHLWHGDLRNRLYMQRHNILKKHDYNPEEDIKINGPTFEWATNKTEMHKEIKDYFFARLEDTDEV